MTPLLSSWRDIAVFLDATPQGDQIGRHAAMLAKRHKAHLVGVYSVARSSLDRHSTYARGSAVAAVVRQQREADEQKVLAASRHFRSEEHTSELPSLMRISYAVFCLTKKKEKPTHKKTKQ